MGYNPPPLRRCLAIDFTEPNMVIVFQIVILLVHAGFVFYRYKKGISEINALKNQINQFFPRS